MNKEKYTPILKYDNEICGPHSNIVCKVALEVLPKKYKQGYLDYLKKEYPDTFKEFEKTIK